MEIKTKYNEDLLNGLKRKETKHVVVLFSSGVESVASAIKLKEDGYKISPILINYNQTAYDAEKKSAERIVKKIGFNALKLFDLKNLNELSKSHLFGEESIDDNDAWVPSRNTLFMILAGIYAQNINADGICLGYAIDDNFVFGDNDYFHHKMLELLLSKSLLRPMQVFMPIKNLSKGELIDILKKNNVLSESVSCWNAKIIDNKTVACGTCANCLERKKYEGEVK